jgi:hypothetical protein
MQKHFAQKFLLRLIPYFLSWQEKSQRGHEGLPNSHPRPSIPRVLEVRTTIEDRDQIGQLRDVGVRSM